MYIVASKQKNFRLEIPKIPKVKEFKIIEVE